MSVHKKVEKQTGEWSSVKFYENEGHRYLKELEKDLGDVEKEM